MVMLFSLAAEMLLLLLLLLLLAALSLAALAGCSHWLLSLAALTGCSGVRLVMCGWSCVAGHVWCEAAGVMLLV